MPWAVVAAHGEAGGMYHAYRSYRYEDGGSGNREEGRTMSRIVVLNHLTLDGVMQGPGRPDEDRRDGFMHGGWAMPDNDAVMDRVMEERYPKDGSLLLGRRTYEVFASFWPHQKDNP